MLVHFGFSEFEFCLVSLFFGTSSEVHRERGDEHHREATHHGSERPEEFRSCVNGEHGYAGKGFVYGFGGDARFRAPVALFNDFNSDDGR